MAVAPVSPVTPPTLLPTLSNVVYTLNKSLSQVTDLQDIGVGNAHNFWWFCIIAKKARARGEEMKTCRGFDVLRDNELKLEDVEASHTLCGAGMVRRKLRVRERASARARAL